MNCWSRWRRLVSDDRITKEHVALMTRVYSRFGSKASNVDGGKSRSAFKKSWYQNQTQKKLLYALIRKINSEGIEPVLLKGAAQLMTDPACRVRVMEDVDLLVPKKSINRIKKILSEDGCLPASDVDLRQAVRNNHAIHFLKKGQPDIDIHWYPSYFAMSAKACRLLRKKQKKINYKDMFFFVPSQEHSLFLVISNASVWTGQPRLRWVADSIRILRSSSDFNWIHFCEYVRITSTSVMMVKAIEYLHKKYPNEVPQHIIQSLLPCTARRRDRIFYWYSRHSWNMAARGYARDIRFLKRIRRSWRDSLISRFSEFYPLRSWVTRAGFQITHMAYFFKYLQKQWRLNNLFQVALESICRFVKQKRI